MHATLKRVRQLLHGWPLWLRSLMQIVQYPRRSPSPLWMHVPLSRLPFLPTSCCCHAPSPPIAPPCTAVYAAPYIQCTSINWSCQMKGVSTALWENLSFHACIWKSPLQDKIQPKCNVLKLCIWQPWCSFANHALSAIHCRRSKIPSLLEKKEETNQSGLLLGLKNRFHEETVN